MKNILLITLIALLFVFTGKAQSAQINADSLASMKYILLGEKAYENDQFDIAQLHFEKALQIDSNSRIASCGLSLVYLNRNQLENAMLYADRSLEIYERMNYSKDYIYDLIVKSKVLSLTNTGRLDEAYSFIYDKYPVVKNDYYYYLLRANALNNVGKYQNALEDIKKADELKPNHFETISLFGVIQYKLGNHAETIKYLEKANAIPGEEKLQNFFLLGCSYYALQDYKKAIVSLEYYLKNAQGKEFVDKNKLLTLDFLSKSYYTLEMYDLAAPVYKQLIEMKEEDLRTKYFYALSLIKSGNYALANTVLTNYISKDPNEGLYYVCLGHLELIRKNNAKALVVYNTGLEKGTQLDSPFEFYLELANAFTTLNNPEGVLRTWKNADKVLENNVLVKNYLLFPYGNDLSRYRNEVNLLVEELIALTENDPISKAYFLALKSVLFIDTYTSQEAYPLINEAISLAPYSEFFIVRAMVGLYSSDAAQNRAYNDNLQAIIDDLDLALQSGDRLRDIYFLKALAYNQFGKHLQACETINSVKNIMSINFTKKEVEQFCDFNKNKKDDRTINFHFILSNYEMYLETMK